MHGQGDSGIQRALLAMMLAGVLLCGGCTTKPDAQEPPRSSSVVLGARAQAAGPGRIRLILTRNGDDWKSKTLPVTPPGRASAVTGARLSRNWVVAECRMDQSSSMLLAWQTETNRACSSPGYAWVVTPAHFVSFHKVHTGRPDNPAGSLAVFLDGEKVALVDELPDCFDGTRGFFCIRLARSAGGSVYRLSWPQEDMWDSSMLLLRTGGDDWRVLGVHHKDSGGRGTVNYSWEVEPKYSIHWEEGSPVVRLEQIWVDGEGRSDDDGGRTWEWRGRCRKGTLAPEGVVWDGPWRPCPPDDLIEQ